MSVVDSICRLNHDPDFRKSVQAAFDAGLDAGAKQTIYLVGSWVATGPRANDTYFAVDYVTTDKTKADARAEQLSDSTIMHAQDDSEFINWDQE